MSMRTRNVQWDSHEQVVLFNFSDGNREFCASVTSACLRDDFGMKSSSDPRDWVAAFFSNCDAIDTAALRLLQNGEEEPVRLVSGNILHFPPV